MHLTAFGRHERLWTQLATMFDLVGVPLRAAIPVVDLLVRLALAKAFFAPGMFSAIGVGELPTAWPMVMLQVIGPVLLAVGLWARPVALLMLMLTLRAQLWSTAQDEHLFWVALFGWYVVHGPATLSLDRLRGHGMKYSSLPLAAPTIAFGDWVKRAIGPLYVVGIRLGLLPPLWRPRSCLIPCCRLCEPGCCRRHY
jgi:uncharacterized membrane protein YphA (DoxX/SURF4 family)